MEIEDDEERKNKELYCFYLNDKHLTSQYALLDYKDKKDGKRYLEYGYFDE